MSRKRFLAAIISACSPFLPRITTMTVGLNAAGDQFSGGYTSEVMDLAGRVLSMSSGTVSGQLIPHPLLP